MFFNPGSSDLPNFEVKGKHFAIIGDRMNVTVPCKGKVKLISDYIKDGNVVKWNCLNV